MKLNLQSLFFKMFFGFWATVVVTGIVLVLTFVLRPGSVPSHWHAMLSNTARSSGNIVVAEEERGGAAAASAYIARLEREAHLRACLFGPFGDPLAGAGCETFKDMVARVVASKAPDFNLRYGIIRVAMMLKGANGREYIFATDLHAGPRAAFGNTLGHVALRWGVAFLVSGLICYLLTLYLTSPILQLRGAAQQLAAGQLSTRAAAGMERRGDELGELVRDFNAMADRIEDLISQQRQLIYDVSHELRSPLARLNVALDLARERKGADPAFAHMEQDLDRLSDMIGRLLTIAKLDTSSAPAAMVTVNLTDLVSQIVHDAHFELNERDGSIELTKGAECLVQGNAELLHSAIENVIRNAIRHTSADSAIEVRLQSEGLRDSAMARVSIRDYGPGVPDSELLSIFRPFYRVAEARDRQSGGAGLGLAIAERIIQLHHGTIHAENAAPHGLLVVISLPLSR